MPGKYRNWSAEMETKKKEIGDAIKRMESELNAPSSIQSVQCCSYWKWAIRERVVCRFYCFCSRARTRDNWLSCVESNLSRAGPADRMSQHLAQVNAVPAYQRSRAWTSTTTTGDNEYVDSVSSLKIFRCIDPIRFVGIVSTSSSSIDERV